MKHILHLLLIGLFSSLISCSGGNATPPASIPAPVSGLISISSPDTEGFVRITGGAGSVENNAEVQVNNLTISSSVSANADADGSFETEIAASIGDSLEILQTVDGSTSTASAEEVPGNAPLVEEIPVDTAVLSDLDEGIVGTTDGTDSFLYIFDLVSFELSGTVTVEDFNLTALDYDTESREGYLIDYTNSRAAVLTEAGELKGGSTLSITKPTAVAAMEEEYLAIVGQESSGVSVTVIDNSNSTPTTSVTALLPHPEGTAGHRRTFALSFDETASEGIVALAGLSIFSNNDTVLSYVLYDINAESLSLSFQVNLGNGEFGDVILFSDGEEALVSDRDNDTVIRFSGTEFATQETIVVGDHPAGMAVEESTGIAFVANEDANSITLIDLTDNSVSGTQTTDDGVGLSPVALSVDDDPSVVVIANEASRSITLLGF
ncbi:MAG: hypothetical protein HY541_03905 [Deltaproteobacteria bacterium]|nr:hypothetical protein [Deltaproteobacteria bacterium]